MSSIRAILSSKLAPFGDTEALLADFCRYTNNTLDLDSELSEENELEWAKGFASVIEERIFAPRQASVSEGGFSQSFKFDDLAKYYLWLCRKYGLDPNEDVLTLCGISTITDKSDLW